MRILLTALLLVTFPACGTVKTKNDCIKECKDRGAEYVGISPAAVRTDQYGGLGDVCQCK